jgi:hypothetical protein
MAASAASLVAQAQTPTITGITNNATPGIVSNAIAPGELVNINGSNLGNAPSVGCGSPTGFTTACGGVSVTVAGKAAGVRNAGASQVIIEVPVDAPAGNGQLVVTRATGGQNLVSQPFAIDVVSYAPELYPYVVNKVSTSAFSRRTVPPRAPPASQFGDETPNCGSFRAGHGILECRSPITGRIVDAPSGVLLPAKATDSAAPPSLLSIRIHAEKEAHPYPFPDWPFTDDQLSPGVFSIVSSIQESQARQPGFCLLYLD